MAGRPRAGDRLPDAELTRNGRATTLQRELADPCLHLLLCGEAEAWEPRAPAVASIAARYGGLLRVHRLTCVSGADGLVDESRTAHRRLGVRDSAQYLVRPDGYIGYRCGATRLDGLESYLARWFRKRNAR